MSMRIPVSNAYISIGSDDEEDPENNDDGPPTESGSRSRTSSVGSFTNPSWPQSYRESIDYQIVSGSPNFTLFSPIPRISSSFLSSSVKNQESFCSSSENLRNPLISSACKHDEAEQAYIGKPICKVQSDASITNIPCQDAERPREERGGSSFTQALLNGLNVLAGVGVLSTPYALREGGFLGIILLFGLAAMCCYTGFTVFLQAWAYGFWNFFPQSVHIDAEGSNQFNNTPFDPFSGKESFTPMLPSSALERLFWTQKIILYIELYACCVEFLILEGDNLSALFPGVKLDIAGIHLDSHHVFCILAALIAMPTVWLRDLSVVSYVSAGGVIATLVVLFSVFWVGAFDGVGFTQGTGPLLNLAQLPVSIGLYGFCYSGHAVFPNVYTSMKRPEDFNLVLQVSFFLVSLIYGGMAVMGITMFGEDTLSSITLNLPKQFIASKIAVWTTIINPITKSTFALTMTPVALCLEELLPFKRGSNKEMSYSVLIRTGLVLSTIAVAVLVPFFGLVMAFIGAFLSMTVSLILPCMCYLTIIGDQATISQRLLCGFIILVGIVCVISGTYSSVAGIVQKYLDP